MDQEKWETTSQRVSDKLTNKGWVQDLGIMGDHRINVEEEHNSTMTIAENKPRTTPAIHQQQLEVDINKGRFLSPETT